MSAGGNPALNGTQGGSATTTATSVTQTAVSSQPAGAAVGNLSSVTTTTTTPKQAFNSSNSDVNGLPPAGASTPSYSSRVESIAQQPLLTDAVVFVPVLVALLLGAVLYRVSYRGREETGEERS